MVSIHPLGYARIVRGLKIAPVTVTYHGHWTTFPPMIVCICS